MPHPAVEPLEGRIFMARVDGIDISHWQGAKTLAQLQQAFNAGKKFMFHKATEGTDYLDPNVAGNVANGRTAGMLVGVYHFPHPDTNSAVDEANWFISQAAQWAQPGWLRPVLDLEDGASLSTTALSTWTTTWCQTVKNALGVDPIIYSNGSYAQSEVNSTVNVYPFWYANPTTAYGDPHTTGTPPSNLLGVWSSKGWNFWQYSWTETVPGFSSGIDADVYNGDYVSLQQNFVIGTVPAVPSTPSPANNATNVNRTGLVLNWADAANATSYDVYLDGAFQVNVAASQWTPPTQAKGAHTWQIYSKNAVGTVQGPVWNFSIATLATPGIPANPSPTNNAIITSTPISLNWDDAANATSYQLWSGGTLIATRTTSDFGPFTPQEGVRPWQIVAINMDGSTTGPAWSFTVDKTPPTATYGNQTPTSGQATFNFTVTYSDAVTGMNASTYDSNDVTVSGPNGFSANASFVSANGNTVTYSISAPGGVWDPADNGNYTVTQVAGQVADNAGWARPLGTIGTFVVNNPYAYITGTTLHIEFPVAPNYSVTLSSDGNGNTLTDESGSVLSFATNSFSDIVVHGTANNDSVTLNTSLAKPITFMGGAGEDAFTVGSGASYSFASDIGAFCSALTLKINNGSSGVFLSKGTSNKLIVDGTATVAAGGNNTLATRELVVTGAINLNDNDLVINYTGDSPMGGWNNGAYDGVYGLLASGANGGSWDGVGISSAAAAASNGNTMLAAAEASTVLGLSGGATDTWSGATVDETTVIIKYTYSGDADLNGELNGDDYFFIDSNILLSGSVYGFGNGDFNLDGEINGDDYFLLDSNILNQGGSL